MAFDSQAITQFPEPALEGMLADHDPARSVESRAADVAVYAGRGLVTGGSWEQVKLPTAAADVSAHFQGFSLYEAMREPVAAGPHFRAQDMVPVLRKGKIWLRAEGTVVNDGPVFLVNGSGAGTPGMIRGDANGGAATLVSRAVVKRGATAGNLVQVEINLI